MLKSMTGFGKAEGEVAQKKITIEIKSLNSKQLDINTRIPGVFKDKDIEVRKAISEVLIRGKVDFCLFIENLGAESNSKINKPIVSSYYRQLSDVAKELDLSVENAMAIIMQLPETLKVEIDKPDVEEWLQVREIVDSAIVELDRFRLEEGISLKKDILDNVNAIMTLLPEVEPFEKERIEKVRERITEHMKEVDQKEKMDLNRFEQEMIYYLEKLDVNEEKVRLKNHCNYFLSTLEEGGAIGKKLGFIAQEMGREINTLGSKANHTEIQKVVIKMKDALEKIKEQVLNVL